MDFILGILESNVNYNNIIMLIGLYFILLWAMVAFWVVFDAKKRYNNNLMIAIGFGLLVLILNIPALIFYLIIRPEKDEDNILYLHSEDNTLSGVNVPIVNFTGEDGFVISLQLKVGNMPSTEKSVNNNMNINVEFDGDSKSMVKKSNANVQTEPINVTKIREVKDNGKSVGMVTVTVQQKTEKAIHKLKETSRKIFANVQNYAKKIDQETKDQSKK